jgi:hypothetical protein
VLGNSEFLFLASLTGADRILAFKFDESLNTPQDAEAVWKRIEPSLQQKGYAAHGAGGGVDIDKTLLEHINVCSNPEWIVTCRSRESGQESECYYYMSNGGYMRLEKDSNLDSCCILTPMRSFTAFYMSVCEMMDYNDNFSDPRISIKLAPEEVSALMKLPLPQARKEHFAQNTSLTLETLADLSEALGGRSDSKCLLAINIPGQKASSELLTFKGRKRLWRLTGDGKRGFALTTLSTDDYQDALMACADNVRPEGGLESA